MSSLVSAMGSLNVKISGRIGLRAVVYFTATTISAVVLGIILVIAVHPGHLTKKFEGEILEQLNVTTADTLMDVFRFEHFLGPHSH